MSQDNQPDHFELICTLLGTLGALMIVVITLASPKAEAADGWCEQFAQGYAIGFCWKSQRCPYVPPVLCPYPVDGQTDGYMVGLMQGLTERRNDQ